MTALLLADRDAVSITTLADVLRLKGGNPVEIRWLQIALEQLMRAGVRDDRQGRGADLGLSLGVLQVVLVLGDLPLQLAERQGGIADLLCGAGVLAF